MGKPFLDGNAVAASLWNWYRKSGTTPWIATLYINCKQWNSLPFAGGVADQPAGLLGLMGLVPKIEKYESMPVRELTKLPYTEKVYYDRISGKNELPENQQWA